MPRPAAAAPCRCWAAGSPAPIARPAAAAAPQVFGGRVVRAPCGVMHGKTSPVWHKDTGLLAGLDNPFK